jgi:uncharacterized protein (DUF2141 family)
MRKGLSYVVILFLIWGCAQVKPIPGGQKDNQPPKPLDFSPSNENTNFSSKSFVITFDEYVTLNNIQQELVISPPLLAPPKVEVRKKSVIVSWKEDLRAQTTYNFQFGDGIVDINEANKAQDLQYVFSTGSELDSATCAFTIINNNTGEKTKDIKVLFFESDSAFFESRPRPSHTAKSNNDGIAKFRYMRPGTFNVYALDDANGNYRFDDGEKIGFLATPFEITSADSILHPIRLCDALPEKKRIDNYLVDSTGTLHFHWPKQWGEIQVKSLSEQVASTWYDVAHDTVWVSLNGKPNDTYIALVATDNNDVRDTISLPFFAQKEDRWTTVLQENKILRDIAPTWKSPFVFNIQNAQQKLFNSDSVEVQTTWMKGDNAYSLQLQGTLKPGKYKGLMLPGTLVNASQIPNDSTVIEFTVMSDKDVGTLQIDLTAWDIQGDYYLELIDKQNQIAKTMRVQSSGQWNMEKIIPGEYMLRIWHDANNNGIPDLTNIKEKSEAEPYSVLSKQVTIRANWEIQIKPAQN